MALQEGDSESMSDITSWLQTNKLEPLVGIFRDRAITLEELYEIVQFGDDDFLAFANELSNDKTIQQTLLKAAKTITIKTEQNAKNIDNNIASPQVIPYPTPQKQPQPQHVIVSPAEHEGISSLYERYDFVSKLMNDIQQQYQQSLALTTDGAIKTIENLFDNILILQIKNKKNELLNMVDELNKKKQTQLKQQSIAMQEYVDLVNKGKKKYDAYIDDGSIDMNTRKKLIVGMINEILKHPSGYSSFITQPNIKFNDYTKDLNNYYNKLLIDDCDQPNTPKVEIVKIGYSTIKIEWATDNIDIVGAKPVLEFEIEYYALPKSFRQKISLKEALKREKKRDKKRDKRGKKKKKKSKRKRKRKKKKTSKNAEDSSDSDEDSSDSDSDSDNSSSDSNSQSDSDTDTKSDDDSDESDEKHSRKKKIELKYEIFDENEMGIDIDNIKWIKNEKKFKVKPRDLKKKKKFKYMFEELRDEWPYIVRLRGRNESGWGKWSKILKCQTNKLIIDSKILNHKQKIQLIKWVPNSKKRKWRLIFKARKDGFTSYQFHQKCDGKGPTVVIVQSTIGNIFGGYTEIDWSSNGNYRFDSKAFIFLLKHAQRKHQKMTKWGVKMNNNNSVYHNSSYGPTFGGGHDWYLCSNCNNTNSSYTSLGSSYEAPKDNNLLAGSYNFMITDYEVFQLTKK